MIELHKLNDKDCIKANIAKDDLYINLLGVDSLEGFTPDLLTTNYLLITNNLVPLGIFILRDFTSNCLSFHVGIYKKHRGDTKKLVKICLDKIRNDLHCVFIATIPEHNTIASHIIKQLGFILISRIKNGSRSGDDILLYGED